MAEVSLGAVLHFITVAVETLFNNEGPLDLWLKWLIIAGLFFFIELLHPRWVVVFFGAGAALAAVVAALAPDAIIVQMAVFFAVSIGLSVVARPLTRRFMYGTEGTLTNAPSYVGREVQCLEEIEGGPKRGVVRLYGSPWNARTAEEGICVKAGQWARVIDIDELCLVVEPLAGEAKEEVEAQAEA